MSLAALILLGLCAFAVATGKLLKRRREELERECERAEVEGELMRVAAYQFCNLREVPEVKR